MAAMARCRRPLSRLFHRLDPHRRDAARDLRCRGIRVPGFSPPAAGAFPARPGKTRPQPFAAGGGGGAISLSLELGRRRLGPGHGRERTAWQKPRLEKAYRNYAMEYVRTAAPVLVQLVGPDDAGYLLHLTGKLIGMQYFDEIARGFGLGRGVASDFAAFLRVLFEAQDDVAELSVSGGAFE